MKQNLVVTSMFAVMIMFTIVISAFGPFLLCVPVKDGVACTGTEAVLARDFQLNGNQTLVIYKDYPMEWPFMSGFFIQIINTVASTAENPEMVQVVQMFTNAILMGVVSVFTVYVYFKRGDDWKRVMMFYVLVPVNVAFGWLETVQVFLILLGITFFEKKREGLAGVMLGLATGVKYLPLLLLPFFIQKAKKKWVITLSWLGTFALGMLIEVALSPTNFLRGISFYSGYGVEGSWLGLLFNNVIEYGTQETWYIGESTTIHLPQLYQIVSGLMMLTTLVLIWKSKYNLVEKMMLVFVAEITLLWLSAPQFIINIAVLLPLINRIKLSIRSVTLWWITGLLGFFPFIILIAQNFPMYTAAYMLQVFVEITLVVFVVIEFFRSKHVK